MRTMAATLVSSLEGSWRWLALQRAMARLEMTGVLFACRRSFCFFSMFLCVSPSVCSCRTGAWVVKEKVVHTYTAQPGRNRSPAKPYRH